jgi:hypothetical protein
MLTVDAEGMTSPFTIDAMPVTVDPNTCDTETRLFLYFDGNSIEF